MSEATIRRKALNGFRWALIGKLIVQILTWLCTILVLRILTPSDYGINAMVMVVIGFGVMIAEFGVSTALVQANTIEERDIRSVFGVVIIINLLAFSAILAVAPLASLYFERPEINSVLSVAALQFPILVFYSIPSALLERELRFKEKAVSEVAASISGSLATLGFAWNGLGYWSLICGALIISLVRVIALNFIVKWPKTPIFSGFGQSVLLRFAGSITAGRVLWYAYSSSDVLIVGRRLGDAALGFYSVATDIASTPLNKVSAPLSQVLTSAVSRLQVDPEASRRMTADVLSYVAGLAFPIYFGLALTVDELVPLLLGAKWEPIIHILILLSLVGPLRALDVVLMSTITASGIARPQIVIAGLGCILFPSTFFAGATLGGLVGVGWAWLLVYPFFYAFVARSAARVLTTHVYEIIRPMVAPLVACLLMASAILLAERFIFEVPTGIRLVLEVALGVLVYGAVLAVLDKRLFMRLLMR